MNAIEFAGRIGRNFRMGTMMSRSSVQSRLSSAQGMSFTEFTYQIFQAYDWLHLFKNHNCKFQIGGHDQMGNIMSGHDLISRLESKPCFGLTLPLITTEMGDKYGKSAGNAVWLSPEKTTPFTYYQFFIRTTDADVEKLLKLFTFDTIGTIGDLMRKHKEKPELRLAQKRLAEQATLLVHGEEGLRKAEQVSLALYKGGSEALSELSAQEVVENFQDATLVELLLEPGQSILDLSMKAKCFPTKSDAIRIISAGGFYVNNHKVTNLEEVLSPSAHFLKNGITLLRVGKRNYYIVKWIT